MDMNNEEENRANRFSSFVNIKKPAKFDGNFNNEDELEDIENEDELNEGNVIVIEEETDEKNEDGNTENGGEAYRKNRKKKVHNESEKKRQQNINKAIQKLQELVPGLKESRISKADVQLHFFFLFFSIN